MWNLFLTNFTILDGLQNWFHIECKDYRSYAFQHSRTYNPTQPQSYFRHLKSVCLCKFFLKASLHYSTISLHLPLTQLDRCNDTCTIKIRCKSGEKKKGRLIFLFLSASVKPPRLQPHLLAVLARQGRSLRQHNPAAPNSCFGRQGFVLAWRWEFPNAVNDICRNTHAQHMQCVEERRIRGPGPVVLEGAWRRKNSGSLGKLSLPSVALLAVADRLHVSVC